MVPRVETLEPRSLLCAATAPDRDIPRSDSEHAAEFEAAVGMPWADALLDDAEFPWGVGQAPELLAENGLPLLASRPAAPVAIYLDFDGYVGVGYSGEVNYAPYTLDADPATFNSAEAASIAEAWRRIAAHFSPFDVNVTTIVPQVPYSWSIITSNASAVAESYGHFDGFAPSAINPQRHLLDRTSALIHEIGHNFGLAHQAEFNAAGQMTQEYRWALDPLHAPIMGADFNGVVSKWYVGHPANEPAKLQDDVAILAAKIAAYQPAGGDGFRVDDHGGAPAAATSLAAVDAAFTSSGIIERLGDVDFFSIEVAAGYMSIDAFRDSMSAADLRLELYSAEGVLLAASDSPLNDQNLSLQLAAGKYFIAVAGHGDYSDLGPYHLSASRVRTDWRHHDVGFTGRAGYLDWNDAALTVRIAGSGQQIDDVTDSFHFAYRSLAGDGEFVARLSGFELAGIATRAGIMFRTSTGDSEAHVAILAALDGSVSLRTRDSIGGATREVAQIAGQAQPLWLRLSRAAAIVTAAVSSDGASWQSLGQVAIDLGETISVGLAITSGDQTLASVAAFDHLALVGNSGVGAPIETTQTPPGNVTVTAATAYSISLTWSAVGGAAGYVVERSDDGIRYSVVSRPTAGSVAFTDRGLAGDQRLFYRVRAADAAGVSRPSKVAVAETRPSAVSNLTITPWTETGLILNWRDVSGEVGYRVERSTNGNTFSVVATVGANAPSYFDNTLSPGTTYQYRVVTLDGIGAASTSSVATAATQLAAVVGLRFTQVTSHRVEITWEPTPGATAYQVERAVDGLEYSLRATAGADITNFADDAVAPVAEWYYRVRAIKGATSGTYSNAINTITPAEGPPPVPWIAADIGNVVVPGAVLANDQGIAMVSSGGGLDTWQDSAYFVYQRITGDLSMTIHLAAVDITLPEADAGVMVRQSLGASGVSFAVVTAYFGAARVRTRAIAGDVSTTTGNGPSAWEGGEWLRLERRANKLRGYVSSDGKRWTLLAGETSIALTGAILVGMVVTSHTPEQFSTIEFNDVSIATSWPGDFNGDKHVTVADIDLLIAAIKSGSNSAPFDLTGDHLVTRDDLDVLVGELVETTVGIGTTYGDINLDGVVDRRDLATFVGSYGRRGSPAWKYGDFDLSGETGLADLLTIQRSFAAEIIAAAPAALVTTAVATAANLNAPMATAKIGAVARIGVDAASRAEVLAQTATPVKREYALGVTNARRTNRDRVREAAASQRIAVESRPSVRVLDALLADPNDIGISTRRLRR